MQKKGFSLIPILLLLGLVAGVIVVGSKYLARDTQKAAPEQTNQENGGEAAQNQPEQNWKGYTSTQCGFEIKYPKEAGGTQNPPVTEDICDFVEVIPGAVHITVYEEVTQPLPGWIKENEICGPRDPGNFAYLDMSQISLKDYTLDTYPAFRVKNLGGCIPGASSALDTVYAKHANKVYKINHIDLAGNKWWRAKTPAEKEAVFDQILATFKFVD